MVNRRGVTPRNKYRRPLPSFFNPDGSVRLRGGLGPLEPWENAPRQFRRRELLAPPPRRRQKGDEPPSQTDGSDASVRMDRR
jgi:hypothetical protein